jgi:hypothetical protein
VASTRLSSLRSPDAFYRDEPPPVALLVRFLHPDAFNRDAFFASRCAQSAPRRFLSGLLIGASTRVSSRTRSRCLRTAVRDLLFLRARPMLVFALVGALLSWRAYRRAVRFLHPDVFHRGARLRTCETPAAATNFELLGGQSQLRSPTLTNRPTPGPVSLPLSSFAFRGAAPLPSLRTDQCRAPCLRFSPKQFSQGRPPAPQSGEVTASTRADPRSPILTNESMSGPVSSTLGSSELRRAAPLPSLRTDQYRVPCLRFSFKQFSQGRPSAP